MNKKRIFIIVGIIALVLVGGISLTFAYFSVADKQTEANRFNSGCLSISLENDSDAIGLTNTYPITDIEGLETKPYTFTITNNCSTSTSYQVNLESLNQASNTLAANYIKVSLSHDTMGNKISLLSNLDIASKSITGSYQSNKLYTGVINGNSSKTFNLRLWVDHSTTIEQANKTYSSKINVVANPDIVVDTTPDVTFTSSGTTLTGTTTATNVKYCVSDDNICTPSTSVTVSNNRFNITLPEKTTKQLVCATLNNTKTVCSDGIKTKKTAVETLIAKNEMVHETFTNDSGTLVDTGYRYEGKTQNNYVRFNNELWRIIGVFDVETTLGKTESLIKLVRNEGIGYIKWDTLGSNDWTDSDIKMILNGQYYNGEDINYTYRKSSDGIVSIAGKSINDIAREMIESVKWNIGGVSAQEQIASKYYIEERGTIGGKSNPSVITWNGHIGLMYASDYGYAADSTNCARTTTLNKYGDTSSCKTNNWLSNGYSQLTLTSNSSDLYFTFYVYSNGSIYRSGNVTSSYGVRPALYLKSNVSIINNGKDGSFANPYDLELG